MAGITKRATRLSDGRELIYFDDADTSLPPERAADARPPGPRPALPTLRQDPLTGEWISIAAARQNRAFLPPAELDPLAPSTPGNLTEIPGNYDVAVFENKSPSFGPGRSRPGVGRAPGRQRRVRVVEVDQLPAVAQPGNPLGDPSHRYPRPFPPPSPVPRAQFRVYPGPGPPAGRSLRCSR